MRFPRDATKYSQKSRMSLTFNFVVYINVEVTGRYSEKRTKKSISEKGSIHMRFSNLLNSY